jgi:hypothetical protein
MKAAFDSQMDLILRLIDTQLQRMGNLHPNEQIVSERSTKTSTLTTPALQSYLVLSGGLGSSPYVRKRLQEYYEGGLGGTRANASAMRILLSAEP